MKRVYFILLPILFFSLSVLSQQDANFPVKKINGTEFLVYPVQSGEGLFSVCRKFEVNQNDVIKANPGVENGLKADQELLIPVNPKNKHFKQKTDNTATSGSFIEHKVGKKQTLFAISRMYDVSQEEIMKNNPGISEGLKEGIVLKIPQKTAQKKEKTNNTEATQKKPEPVQNNVVAEKNTKPNTTIHVVQPKETLYSISKIYNVEVSDIVELNPDADKVIKTGTELKIPVQSKDNLKTDTTSDKLPAETEGTGKQLKDKVKPNIEPVRIAFLLPFMADNQKGDNSTDRFIEFYAGALLAIQEAKELGVSFEISYFDTEKSEQKITEILQKEELRDVDLIVGPAYSNQIPLVSEFAKENRINTVVPFSSKVFDIDFNPYLFQFNPGTDAEIDFVTSMLNKNYKYSNIIFVNLPNISILDEGKTFTDGLKSSLKKNKISYSEVNPDSLASFIPGSTLKLNHENIVFFNTDKYSQAQAFIQKIAEAEDYKTTFYYELNWQNQENLKVKSIAVSPFKSKLNDSKLKSYNAAFAKYFKWKVADALPRYDLLGYDLTKYFITQIFYSGTNFGNDKNKLDEMSGIQSYLKFARNGKFNGFMNQQLNLIESDNTTK